LRAQKATFAVVGGLAASVRGEARFTRDVDVAVDVPDDSSAEALVHFLIQAGYELLATVEHDKTGRLATARLRDADGVVCDLVFATCGIEHEVVASAEELEILPTVSVPTASAESLLAMKTLSVTARRARDLDDIRAIVRQNPDLDEARVTALLQLIEERGCARGQNLLEKWRGLRASL